MTRNKVTLCGIIKNEVKTVKRTLDSIDKFADEYIIGIDDSVSDGTDKLVKRWFKKRKKKGEIYYFRWRGDFSHARNIGLKKATGDWILILDFHEYFPDEQKVNLKNIFNNVLSHIQFCYIKLLNKETSTIINQLRLFRRSSGVFYGGKVHNTINLSLDSPYSLVKNGTLLEGLLLIHDRDKAQIKGRAEQRADMIIGELEETLKKNPDDNKSLFYLSRQYLLLNEFDKSIEKGKKYVQVCKDPYSRSVAYANLAVAHFAQKKNQEALPYIEASMKADDAYPYPYILLAFMRMDERNFDEAEKLLLKARERNAVPMTFLPVPIGFYTWFPVLLLAEVKFQQGDYDGAINYLEQVATFKNYFCGGEEDRVNALYKKIEQKSTIIKFSNNNLFSSYHGGYLQGVIAV